MAKIQSHSGVDKGELNSKETSQTYNDWAAAMQLAYYKNASATPTANYFSPSMSSHHAYVWNGQPIMSPYPNPSATAYAYSHMYPSQHTTSVVAHPQPITPYAYTGSSSKLIKVDGFQRPLPQIPPASETVLDVLPGYSNLTEGSNSTMLKNDKKSFSENLPQHKVLPIRNVDVSNSMKIIGASINSESNSKGNIDTTNNSATNNFNSIPPNGYVANPSTQEAWPALPTMVRPQRASSSISEPAMQYQDERELKRQRRKQSNRESARRSRLRKQAECEDLGTRINKYTEENVKLRTEISRLTEKHANLVAENKTLMDKAKAAGLDLTFITEIQTNANESLENLQVQKDHHQNIERIINNNERSENVIKGNENDDMIRGNGDKGKNHSMNRVSSEKNKNKSCSEDNDDNGSDSDSDDDDGLDGENDGNDFGLNREDEDDELGEINSVGLKDGEKMMDVHLNDLQGSLITLPSLTQECMDEISSNWNK